MENGHKVVKTTWSELSRDGSNIFYEWSTNKCTISVDGRLVEKISSSYDAYFYGQKGAIMMLPYDEIVVTYKQPTTEPQANANDEAAQAGEAVDYQGMWFSVAKQLAELRVDYDELFKELEEAPPLFVFDEQKKEIEGLRAELAAERARADALAVENNRLHSDLLAEQLRWTNTRIDLVNLSKKVLKSVDELVVIARSLPTSNNISLFGIIDRLRQSARVDDV